MTGKLGRTCITLYTLLLLLIVAPVSAGGEDPYPEFVASYDIRINGLQVGVVKFGLKQVGADQYLYHSEARKAGLASMFGADKATEQSRWRHIDNRIQVLEYRTSREDGDDDDNAHLIFDWDNMQAKNIGAGKKWVIDIPEFTLDKMVMQLAMLFDLRDGKTEFRYPVALRGRVKHYHFALVGSDTTQLPFGNYKTLKLERMDDREDKSWVWSAPTLNHFPVRFLKHKTTGLKTEILLREIKFEPAIVAADSITE